MRQELSQRENLWVKLGRQQLTLAGGGVANDAVDPQNTLFTCDGATAVFQQGLKLAYYSCSFWRCLSVAYHWMEI